MEERLKYAKAAPGAYRAMRALESYVDDCGLEPLLLELVKMRASQINGCAYCLDMHSKDARALGEATVAAADHILASDQVGESPQALGDQLRVFDMADRMTDHTRDQDPALR